MSDQTPRAHWLALNLCNEIGVSFDIPWRWKPTRIDIDGTGRATMYRWLCFAWLRLPI